MKQWKSSIVIIGLVVILSSSALVSATEVFSDGTNDVLHWNGTNWQNWQWNVGNRPNVDIVEISYIAGDRLTISLTVKGNINTDKSMYHIWYNTTDAYYHMVYIPESDDEQEPIIIGMPMDISEWTYEDWMNYVEPESETSVSGNTITGTIDWVTDNHAKTGFYAWAQEWDVWHDDESVSEFWIDFAPNDYAWYGQYQDYYPDDDEEPNGADNGDDNGGDKPSNGTPGFEALALIAALGVALIILKRRK